MSLVDLPLDGIHWHGSTDRSHYLICAIVHFWNPIRRLACFFFFSPVVVVVFLLWNAIFWSIVSLVVTTSSKLDHPHDTYKLHFHFLSASVHLIRIDRPLLFFYALDRHQIDRPYQTHTNRHFFAFVSLSLCDIIPHAVQSTQK